MAESQASPAAAFRMAHTMIRVKDLDRSLDFYTRMLGMRMLRQSEYPDGKFTNTFVGYGDEETDAVIELTYNWEVPDVYATCEKLESEGVRITRPPGPMKHGTRVIAFIEDPDGYKIELVERD